MINRDYFSHSIPGYGNVFKKMSSSGFCYSLAGENIGWITGSDSTATASIHEMFMNSSGHRANILGKDWDTIGVGAYKGADGKKMYTVLFANKCGSSSKATTKPKAEAQAASADDAAEADHEAEAARDAQADTDPDARTHTPRDAAAVAAGPGRPRRRSRRSRADRATRRRRWRERRGDLGPGPPHRRPCRLTGPRRLDRRRHHGAVPGRVARRAETRRPRSAVIARIHWPPCRPSSRRATS